jgi:hypothetical protein
MVVIVNDWPLILPISDVMDVVSFFDLREMEFTKYGHGN